jgi:hypothetical protein
VTCATPADKNREHDYEHRLLTLAFKIKPSSTMPCLVLAGQPIIQKQDQSGMQFDTKNNNAGLGRNKCNGNFEDGI